MGIKKAELAGNWYAGSGAALAAEVDACLERSEKQFGRAKAEGAPAAVVAPHAGLAFSGPVAAAAYRLARKALGKIDTFVVFGANHRVRIARPAVWAEGAWQTPLGDIEIDAELAAALIDQGAGQANETAHRGDNSIELQTPFIKHMFPGAKMVPVAMGFFADAWRLGELASVAAAATGKTVLAVASTDLTHYGAAFGVMPAGTGKPALEWIQQNDKRFLDALVNLDLDNIVPIAERDGSACGAGAAAAAAGWAKARGCRHGRILAWTNSHEIMPRGEAEHVVGYASLAFETAMHNA